MAKWEKRGKEFLRRRAAGESYVKVAKSLGISVTTSKAWGKRWSPKIDEMRDANIEAFVADHLADLDRRMALRAEQMSRIRDELSDRDLKELTTDQLMRLLLRWLESAKREAAPERVEITDPLRMYERVLERCLSLPPEVVVGDIPKLAAQFAEGKKVGVEVDET